MTDNIVGVGPNTGEMKGDLDALDGELESFAALGCATFEITASGLDVVVDADLSRTELGRCMRF